MFVFGENFNNLFWVFFNCFITIDKFIIRVGNESFIFGFETKKTIEDAIKDLKDAFTSKKLTDTLTNEKYFNIKRMNNLNLK